VTVGGATVFALPVERFENDKFDHRTRMNHLSIRVYQW
jgi:hypothetical protein